MNRFNSMRQSSSKEGSRSRSDDLRDLDAPGRRFPGGQATDFSLGFFLGESWVICLYLQAGNPFGRSGVANGGNVQ